VRKGGKKGHKNKDDSKSLNHGKKYLSYVKCYKCHKFGHYASQCPEKKGKGKRHNKFAGSEKASMGENKFASKLDTAFSMVSCLSMLSGVKWYVDNGSLTHKIVNKLAFFGLEEQDSDMHVELGDDVKYSMIGMDSISFYLPTREILELHEVLYGHGLTKKLLLLTCITNPKCKIEFDDQ
jgi:hypothetical protein